MKLQLPPAAGVAAAALLANKMRSLLTTLGIVIGVAAVVTMQPMGEGATAYVSAAISGLGSNMLMAVPGAAHSMGAMTLGVPLFTSQDLDAIRREARSVGHLASANNRSMRIVAGSNNRTVNVSGVSPEYFTIREWGAAEGRLPSAQDEREAALTCAIGKTAAEALFPGLDPVGRELRINKLAVRVVGLMESKGASAFGTDQDDVVFMPYSTFSRRLVGTERIGMIMASAVSKDRIDDAKEEITIILRRRRHIPAGEEDDFGVRDPRELQAVLSNVTGMLTTLLAGIAAISLLVGGIGIMNIMLVSVTERTREIGIRLAVGARAAQIRTQFLVEAVVLSSLGGVLGIALGLMAAMGVARGIGIPFIIPVLATPLAFGISVLVGIVFGVVPARKASRLNPLAALRYE